MAGLTVLSSLGFGTRKRLSVGTPNAIIWADILWCPAGIFEPASGAGRGQVHAVAIAARASRARLPAIWNEIGAAGGVKLTGTDIPREALER